MVKSGRARAAKYSDKFDDKVYLYRVKAQRKAILEKYEAIAKALAILQAEIKALAENFEVPPWSYGQLYNMLMHLITQYYTFTAIDWASFLANWNRFNFDDEILLYTTNLIVIFENYKSGVMLTGNYIYCYAFLYDNVKDIFTSQITLTLTVEVEVN